MAGASSFILGQLLLQLSTTRADDHADIDAMKMVCRNVNGLPAVASDYRTPSMNDSVAFGSLMQPKWHSANETKNIMIAWMLPLAVGLLLGYWLGRTRTAQARPEAKSLVVIVCSWLHSVYSISKMWFRYQLASLTCDGIEPVKEVTVCDVNGKELRKNYIDTPRESGCDFSRIPRHVAVIMDGNRRYGKRKYGKGSMGHFDGAQMALQAIEWMSTEGVKHLTLYAFSTENWNRDSSEIDTLMGLFLQFVEGDLRPVVFNRKVRVKHICTDKDHLPPKLYRAIQALCEETSVHPENSLTLNVCLSYGSRGEIAAACRGIASECVDGKLKPEAITEDTISQHLLTKHSADADVLIRTSGEERISNFLLWQLAYTEFFFLDKDWPELEKEDFLKVIRSFAQGRQRRFGE